MYVLGITGGIGSGKSAVSDRFAQLGIKVVDADIASRVIVEPGKPALTEIAQHFGQGIILDDGGLDRRTLRERIFSDPEERSWLESLLHPLIGEYLQTELHCAKSAYAILVSPLLLETGQALLCNRILVVDVPESVQIERVIARDNTTLDQVQAIIKVQTSRQQRLERADDVVVNDKALCSLDKIVAKLHAQYLGFAKECDKSKP